MIDDSKNQRQKTNKEKSTSKLIDLLINNHNNQHFNFVTTMRDSEYKPLNAIPANTTSILFIDIENYLTLKSESKQNNGPGVGLPFIISIIKLVKNELTNRFVIPAKHEDQCKSIFVKHPNTGWDRIWLNQEQHIDTNKLELLSQECNADINIISEWCSDKNTIMFGKGIANDKRSLEYLQQQRNSKQNYIW